MAWPTTFLTEHVERLAEEHKLTLHWVDSFFDGEAQEFTGDVWCPRPGDARPYVVALHEIGHCANPTARELRHDDPEACERAAWEWAFDNVHPLVELTATSKTVRDFAEDCIRTHLVA